MKSPLVRSLMAVFVGIVVCGVVIFLIELPASFLHPVPASFDPQNREQVREHNQNAPLAAMLVVLAAYVVGPFVGAWVAARLAGRAPLPHAGIVAGFFFLASVANLFSVPGHPIWFAVANLTLFVPAVWLAAHLARPKPVQPGQEMVASK